MGKCNFVGYEYPINKEIYDFLCNIKKDIIKRRKKELQSLQKIIDSDNFEQHHINTFNYLISIPCKIGVIEYFSENKDLNYYTATYKVPVYKQHLENESKERFEEIIKNDDERFKSDLINLGFTGDVSNTTFL